MSKSTPQSLRDSAFRRPEGSLRPCGICANFEGNRRYIVREMMFGLGDQFPYVECAECGCLQIEEVPADMSRFYTPTYFSLASQVPRPSPLMRAAQTLRCRFAAEGKGLLGKWLLNRFHDATVASLADANVTRRSRILDVGSGTGRILHQLKEAGFDNVLGVDPYLDQDLEYPSGVRILKRTVHEVDGGWDLVMFHHSFEHVPDPLGTLIAARRLLTESGCCLIRMPVASSYSWRRYRENWVQLDAPRHLFVHSVKSLEHLALKAGLYLRKVVFDSDEFQFWGSEQCLRNIAMGSECSHGRNPARSIFTPSEIRSFRHRAASLNKQGTGDQAAFYLASRNVPK